MFETNFSISIVHQKVGSLLPVRLIQEMGENEYKKELRIKSHD